MGNAAMFLFALLRPVGLLRALQTPKQATRNGKVAMQCSLGQQGRHIGVCVLTVNRVCVHFNLNVADAQHKRSMHQLYIDVDLPLFASGRSW